MILLFLAGFLLFSCDQEKPKINDLLASYCPAEPNSCKDTLITIEGYLDRMNISTTKFFLYPNRKKTPTMSDAFNNSFIEVFYPESDLSRYFSARNREYYFIDFDVKAIVHRAKIHVFQRNQPGIDDGNYLTVDSISQIDFYRIEKTGELIKLK